MTLCAADWRLELVCRGSGVEVAPAEGERSRPRSTGMNFAPRSVIVMAMSLALRRRQGNVKSREVTSGSPNTKKNKPNETQQK